MKIEKQFDCLEMKSQIQERLMKEAAEFGEQEAQRRRAKRLSDDPILGAFLRMRVAVITQQAVDGPDTGAF